eukprot:scaffold2562_cov18-Phaeocystis_antarctica.AAC.1
MTQTKRSKASKACFCYFARRTPYFARAPRAQHLRARAAGKNGSFISREVDFSSLGRTGLARARQAAASDEEESPEARHFGYGYIDTGSRQRAKSGGVRWLSGRILGRVVHEEPLVTGRSREVASTAPLRFWPLEAPSAGTYSFSSLIWCIGAVNSVAPLSLPLHAGAVARRGAEER